VCSQHVLPEYSNTRVPEYSIARYSDAVITTRARFYKGFTLIELLLVIGVIAILASVVILAINPTKQLGKARDTQRLSDLNSILSAVYQYAIDNNGAMPTIIPTGTAREICGVGSASCMNGVNLNGLLSGTYLLQIPQDPQVPTGGTGTNYFIVRDVVTQRITVTAPGAEQSPAISVTR
jgi:prepilin-type N-terminal cleavage/methylation domain-containing protein